MNKLSDGEIVHRLEVYKNCGFSAQSAAKVIGITRRAFDRFLDKYGDKDQPIPKGVFDQTKIKSIATPRKGQIKRYLLTCAQNNTKVHEGFFNNLTAYADYLGASLKISQFTYNKTAFQKNRKQGDDDTTNYISYDSKILPYVSNNIERLAPTLVWCGNLQILPTAVNPTSGFDDYTSQSSTVIPHTKVQVRPVPTARCFDTKHLYTTGCCTLKNYIMAKAGQKAEFHHTYAALLVEVLDDGTWFARQLVADREGTFHDLDKEIKDQQVSHCECVDLIQWGDIHYDNIDKSIEKMFFIGKNSVLDTLKPHTQTFHDLVDGQSHNPHEIKNHIAQYRKHLTGSRSIEAEFNNARDFIDKVAFRHWCKSIVIWSNHDEFLRRFLENSNYKSDYENREFILRNELLATQQAKADPSINPCYFKNALNSLTAKVLDNDGEDLSVNGVLIPFHGHQGSGGARGSVLGFSKSGHKTMTGHSHSMFWFNGATSAGTCSKLYLGYNNGLSTWSHTFTVLYKSGKRCQVTANAQTGKWRA